MKPLNCNQHRAFALLELLIFVALWALLAVTTLRSLGDSRMVRANARDRNALAILAQSELEKARFAQQLPLGTTAVFPQPHWPSGTQITLDVSPTQTSGILQLDVTALRKSIESKPAVRLTTLVREPVS